MIYVIIPAGGTSSRFSKTESKLNAKLENKSLLEVTINQFLAIKKISHIILVCPKDEETNYRQLMANQKKQFTH